MTKEDLCSDRSRTRKTCAEAWAGKGRLVQLHEQDGKLPRQAWLEGSWVTAWPSGSYRGKHDQVRKSKQQSAESPTAGTGSYSRVTVNFSAGVLFTRVNSGSLGRNLLVFEWSLVGPSERSFLGKLGGQMVFGEMLSGLWFSGESGYLYFLIVHIVLE